MVASWTAGSDDGVSPREVIFRWFTRSGEPLSPEAVIGYSVDSLEAHIEATPTGPYALLWQGTDPAGSVTDPSSSYLAFLTAPGDVKMLPLPYEKLGGRCTEPALAALPESNLPFSLAVACWHHLPDGGEKRFSIARLTHGGEILEDAEWAVDYELEEGWTLEETKIAVSQAGIATLLWTETDDSSEAPRRLMAAGLDLASKIVAVDPFTVKEDPEYAEFSHSVAALDEATFLITWQHAQVDSPYDQTDLGMFFTVPTVPMEPEL